MVGSGMVRSLAGGLEIGKYNIDYFLICGRPVVFQLDRLSWIVLVII